MLIKFGDKLPEGLDTDLFVIYTVESVGKFLFGPLLNNSEAEYHRADIAAYAKIIDVKVIQRKEYSAFSMEDNNVY